MEASIACLPVELYWSWFSYLEPVDLTSASFVNKQWRCILSDEAFLKVYSRYCSKPRIESLRPSLFSRLLPYFSFSQAMHIDGSKRWTRHILREISETKENKTNLRIAKLLASLNWYQEITEQYIETHIDNWKLDGCKTAEKIRQSVDFIHLFMLTSGSCSVYGQESIKEPKRFQRAVFDEKKNLPLKRKGALRQLPWNSAKAELEYLIAVDSIFLREASPLYFEKMFYHLFKRRKIKHLVHPLSASLCLSLPDFLFKALFSALTKNFIQEKRKRSEQRDENSPKGFFNALLQWGASLLSSSVDSDSLDFDVLKIEIRNNDQLFSLLRWLTQTKVFLGFLHLYIGDKNEFITAQALELFKEGLPSMNLQKISFSGRSDDAEVNALCYAIEILADSLKKEKSPFSDKR